MAFPSSIDSFTGFTGSETLSAANHAAQENQQEAAIVAVETKLGTGASTPTNGLFLVGNGTGTSTWRTIAGSDLSFSQLSILQAVYPVGCIYTETTGVNPATTFGFGTWAATGQGRVLVGAGTSDETYTAGATGGESNHLLSGAESGTSAHSHNITDPGHNHTGQVGTGVNGSGSVTGGTVIVVGSGTMGTSTTGITINNSTAASASNSHNNLQPYLVVYYWTRTA